MMRAWHPRAAIAFAIAFAIALPASATRADRGAPMTAVEAIRRAVDERLGGGNDVAIVTIDVPERAGAAFTSARPDPAARLGRPMRFTLVPVSGSPVVAVATLQVVGHHVVAQRSLARHDIIAAEDVSTVRGELRDMPIRRLPSGEQLMGSRVLRPIAAGSVVLPGAVAVRRAVEPGDKVTVVAVYGDIEVSATLRATDGGDPGDVIRVVNTDTRRSLRGRVVKEGLVEVNYAR